MKNGALSVLACIAVAGTAGAAEKIAIDGSTTVGPIAKAFAEYFMGSHPEVNITVSESGSGNGAKSLINNTCDIADMSRPMKDGEFKAAADKGIQPVPHVVALDGLAVITHPSNPVKGLSVEQIRKIYVGEISNWKEVGGPDQKIVVISRDTNSGTYETFEDRVLDKQKIREDAEYVGSNGAVRQRIQNTPNAIGYVGLGFVDKTVKAFRVNGIPPAAETVQSGEYPIARPLFMYTNGYPQLGSALFNFVNINLTKDGQEMIQEIGFVPVTSY